MNSVFRRCLSRAKDMSLKVSQVATPGFPDQEPGTSGLRKPVKTFKQENYTENFVQSIFNYFGDKLEGSTFLLGGDGRFNNKEAARTIMQMCAANGVRHLLVGQNGILSTPAASHLIVKRETLGGIILTASHNPGGPDKDFGIKLNMSNGGAAPSAVTKKIFETASQIREYKTCPDLECPINEPCIKTFQVEDREMTVEVIDSVTDYVELMKLIFDFSEIKKLLAVGIDNKPFKILIDCMHGVTGPYAKAIFQGELNSGEGSVINSVPLEDFGGGHPDPNLTYATKLVSTLEQDQHDFGAAFDGDGDRNMILGRKAFFVTPSDSLAVLAANLKCIPYFQSKGIMGYARSMPTAAAVDRVAEAKNLPVFEVPTGWKFFCNLMDANMISICGEESFGTGSVHIREKDGIWAALAWLNVIAHVNKPVENLIRDHWAEYGRNVALRCDFDGCQKKEADEMMLHLEALASDKTLDGKEFSGYTLQRAEDFIYVDPVENITVKKQGVRLHFDKDCKAAVRLSGTGSSGATVRMYFEKYTRDPCEMNTPRETLFKDLIQVVIEVSKLKQYVGIDKPTVIT